MSGMDSQQRGTLDVLLIPVILLALLFIGTAAFGFWAFSSRQNYKNNANQMATTAVNSAVQQTESNDSAKYAQESKYPLQTFTGPSSFASISFKYPKTWSAYVVQESSSSTPINGYFYPGIVPDVTNPSNAYALRVQLLEESYSDVLQQYAGQVNSGALTDAQYTAPKLPNVIGSKLQGQISSDKRGTMVILPVLNMTLEIWTESSQFQSDFANSVLSNLTFQP
jgi:multidrug efflux pump subunit AcrA (membrane-fusion protein)